MCSLTTDSLGVACLQMSVGRSAVHRWRAIEGIETPRYPDVGVVGGNRALANREG